MNSGGLRKHARQGLVWGGGFRVFHLVLQFGMTIILARLVSPRDYGTYAVVAGIISFLNAVSFENFTRHILQVRPPEEIHFQDHFTAAVGIQFIIFLNANLIAIILRWIPSYEGIAGYIHFMSPILLLSSIGGFHYICLEQQLSWARYRTLQMIGIVFLTVTVLAMAWAGFGVLALLVGPNLKYIPPAVDLFLVQRFKPTWQFSWARYKSAFYFGMNRFASTAGVKGRAVIESNWLMQLIGLSTLGLMNRAVSFSQLINSELSTIVGQSLYPVLTRIEPGSARYREASTLLFQGMAWVLIPLAVLASILAHPIIVTLYGDQWTACVEFVPPLMFIGVLAAFGRIGYQLALAACAERRCLAYDVLRLILTIAALALWPFHQSLTVYLWTVGACEALCSAMLIAWLCASNAASAEKLLENGVPVLVGLAFASMTVIPMWDQIDGLRLFSPVTLGTSAAFIGTYLVILRVLYPVRMQRLVEVVPMSSHLSQILRVSRKHFD